MTLKIFFRKYFSILRNPLMISLHSSWVSFPLFSPLVAFVGRVSQGMQHNFLSNPLISHSKAYDDRKQKEKCEIKWMKDLNQFAMIQNDAI